ncbi:MAG: hypothetical protein RR519_00565 [Victivallaceae bacterium]
MKNKILPKAFFFSVIFIVPLFPSLFTYSIIKKKLHYWFEINERAMEIGILSHKDKTKRQKNEQILSKARTANPLYLKQTLQSFTPCRKERMQLQTLLNAPDFITDPILETRFLFLSRNNMPKVSQLEDRSETDFKIFKVSNLEIDEEDIVGLSEIAESPSAEKPICFISRWQMNRARFSDGNEAWNTQIEIVQREMY